MLGLQPEVLGGGGVIAAMLLVVFIRWTLKGCMKIMGTQCRDWALRRSPSNPLHRLALYFLKDKERQKLLKENASADKDDPESAWLLSSDDEKDKPKKTDKSDSKGDNKNDKVVAVEVLLLSPKAGNELGFVCVQRKDTVEQMRTQLSLMLARARSLPGIKKNPMLWHRFELFSCREPHGFAFPVSDAHADAPAHLFFSAGQLALLRPLEEAAEVDTEVTAETATDADSNLDTETHGETTHSTAKTAARKAKKSKEKEVLPRSPSRAESGSVDLLSSA
uniref:Uncharacterized protein n=2 Tax=Chrysotila carterae TaxID=13221 RepID=A0A7S4ESU6_CHRCT|mmetsp:Transcript_39555/g.86893  ORF Transcript_39555/g.86893 Transcript_39555/m.86893 type:complete len:278 (+) Transcript_39555:68-901(+)